MASRPVTRTAASKFSGPAADWIAEHLGGTVVKEKFMGGSNWSSAYAYETDQGAKYFVKTALGARDEAMFAGEALGLRAMADARALRIPQVHHVGPLPGGRGSFIIMEYLELGGSCPQEELGRRLGAMHMAQPTVPEAASGRFGFPVDNTIGATPQPNGWMDNWVDFYRERRLRHQLRLAGDTRLSRLGDKLLDNLEVFFEDCSPGSEHEIRPSILHGDLWSGNIAAVGGEPSIFDPATYYGHHEAEFGMSWCAGFTGGFWKGYHSVVPKAPGFDRRRPLYELYHYINHYNLFGGGYYNTSVRILERLTEQL